MATTRTDVKKVLIARNCKLQSFNIFNCFATSLLNEMS